MRRQPRRRAADSAGNRVDPDEALEQEDEDERGEPSPRGALMRWRPRRTRSQKMVGGRGLKADVAVATA